MLQVVSERLFSTPCSSTSSVTGSEEGVEAVMHYHCQGEDVIALHLKMSFLNNLMFRRAIKNTQTHMWAKMGEECTGKGSEGIGPTDRTSR